MINWSEQKDVWIGGICTETKATLFIKVKDKSVEALYVVKDNAKEKYLPASESEKTIQGMKDSAEIYIELMSHFNFQ